MADDDDVDNTMAASWTADLIVQGPPEVSLDENVKAGKRTLLRVYISAHLSLLQ